jgi:hypothetical protein
MEILTFIKINNFVVQTFFYLKSSLGSNNWHKYFCSRQHISTHNFWVWRCFQMKIFELQSCISRRMQQFHIRFISIWFHTKKLWFFWKRIDPYRIWYDSWRCYDTRAGFTTALRCGGWITVAPLTTISYGG